MRKLERMRVGIGNRKRLKAQDDIRWGRPLITTGAMIVLIVAASFGVTNYINRMEEQRSFERLYEEADTLADNIEKYSANDREELEMLSAVIAGYDDLSSPELWNLLDSYTNIGMMSRIELLLPGDVVLTGRGEKVDAAGTLSFEEEAAKGVHISRGLRSGKERGAGSLSQEHAVWLRDVLQQFEEPYGDPGAGGSRCADRAV